MSALIKHVALVSQSDAVPFGQVAKIAAALQKQVVRDFGPIWQVQATVDAFESINDVPPGYWPILIRDDIGYAGAAGIHLDKNGQPYALVQASEGVPMTCDHELLEMLADPFGDRLVASDSIKQGQGRVNYLVEVCDPSEAKEFGYTVNGILLSDFYTPQYFDPVTSGAVRYSFTGAIKKPKEVLQGGYLSWMVPETGEWWQATFFGASMGFRGPLRLERKNGRSWRETVDGHTTEPRKALQGKALAPNVAAESKLFMAPAMESAANAWAAELMKEVTAVIKENT